MSEDRDTQPPIEAVDLATMVARFRDDAVLAVPALGERHAGREAIVRFLASPAGGALDRLALIKTRANGSPALAVYRYVAAERCYEAFAIFVSVAEGYPGDVVVFPDARLFARFGLPAAVA